MSIDNITAKILSDATGYADGLILSAKQEAESLIAKAEKEAGQVKAQMSQKAHDDAVALKHRKQSIAELEARKMRLATKQKAVANAMEAAVDHLADMEPDAYIALLAKTITKTGLKEGQLVLNAKDKAAVGEKLVKAANESLKGGKLTLSDQIIDVKGGFILKYGALEINSSLEIMVNSIKETVTQEIVSVLFNKHEGMYEKI